MTDLFGNEKILALSLKEPFAGLMLSPWDKDETRLWPTGYRGLVLICASKKGYTLNELKTFCNPKQIEFIMDNYRPEIQNHAGNAIGLMRLHNCKKMTPPDEEKCYVKYFPDLFVHQYTERIAINPIPWKGTQGWKTVDDATKAKIKLLPKFQYDYNY